MHGDKWSAVQHVFPWATAEEAHMSKRRKQAKCKILYEHLTAVLKHIFEVCLLTGRKKIKNAHIHDFHFTFDFEIQGIWHSQQLVFRQCVPYSVQELKLKSQIPKCMTEVHVTFKTET